MDGLGASLSQDIVPVIVDTSLTGLMADGIDYLIGEYGQVDVGLNALIVLMMYRADVEVCFQTPEGALYLSDGVVDIPKC